LDRQRDLAPDELLELLTDRMLTPDSDLPHTDVPLQLEPLAIADIS
jgi:hypothetical protein